MPSKKLRAFESTVATEKVLEDYKKKNINKSYSKIIREAILALPPVTGEPDAQA